MLVDNGTKRGSSIGTTPKDHRIRLNDAEILDIYEALKAYQGSRPIIATRWRFHALTKGTPVRR